MDAKHDEETILWRRLDRPGFDAARVERQGSEWKLSGTALFLEEGAPCRLRYEVVCDGDWRTRRARVDGWLGERSFDVELSADAGGWRVNGTPVDGLEGCADVDFAFSPATNLLPIRRTHLAVGQEAVARAAWLRFPDLGLEPLEQTYRRTAPGTFVYGTKDGFATELTIDDAGFVTLYPQRWQRETGGPAAG
jgi:uncharacterized protein